MAYRVVLPELFTLTAAEYEALHGAWLKALRVLPDYTIVHKQDYFTEEHYRPDLASDESFLGRAFERHFNERPFLRHSCYLFVTKTSKEQMRRRSDFSSLCRGFIVPQEIRDTESVTLFLDAAEQMRRILCDAGFIRLEPLTADEIVGTADDSGLIAATSHWHRGHRHQRGPAARRRTDTHRESQPCHVHAFGPGLRAAGRRHRQPL